MQTARIYAVVGVLSTLVAAIPVVYPSLDLAVANYFLQANPPVKTGQWWWVNLLNEYIPTIFRSLALGSFALWWWAARSPARQMWVLPAAFIGLSLLIGPGLLVSGAKEITQRARPFHVVEFGGTRQFSPALHTVKQCDDNCAFVSGHTADGFYLASLMLLFPRRRWWWLAGGLFGGVVIGFARVSVGAHWLSDALWAFPVTLLGTWLVYRAMVYFGQMQPPPEPGA